MRKKALLLSVVLALSIFLFSCASSKADNGSTRSSDEDRSAFSIREDALPSEESQSTPVTQGLRAPYYIGRLVHADLVFRGTITSVKEFDGEEKHTGGFMVPYTDSLITVRIDKVYSGTPSVEKGEILLYCGDTAAMDGKNIGEGFEYVFFTRAVDDVWTRWFKSKTYVLEGYDQLPSMALYSNYWEMLIYKDGLVQAPFVWGDEYKPSVAMTEEEQEKFVAGWAAHPEVTLRGIYYTEDDFIKALEYLKERFPAEEPLE